MGKQINETTNKLDAYVSCAIGPLSMVGSALTLIAILRMKQSSRNTALHRMLGSLSCLDFISSLGFSFGPLLVTRNTQIPNQTWYIANLGTVGSCTLQGALLQIGYSSFFYSMCISIYYVMVARYNMSERFFSRRVEPFMHLCIWVYTLAATSYALAREFFNPLGNTICEAVAYPPGCDFLNIPGYVCQRGEGAFWFKKNIVQYPLLAANAVVLICLGILVLTVVGQYRRSRRFVFQGSDSNDSPMKRQAQQVIVQSILFGSSVTLVLFFQSLIMIRVTWFETPMEYVSTFQIYSVPFLDEV